MAAETDPPHLPSDPAEEADSMGRVTPLRRVETIGTQMVPMRQELVPPAPAKPARQGVQLSLRPFSPKSGRSQMQTMSDLISQSNPVPQKEIARVKGRHFPTAALPKPAVPPAPMSPPVEPQEAPADNAKAGEAKKKA